MHDRSDFNDDRRTMKTHVDHSSWRVPCVLNRIMQNVEQLGDKCQYAYIYVCVYTLHHLVCERMDK